MIFLAVVAAYWAVGIKRIPVYFQRIKEQDRKRYPLSYKESEFQNATAAQSIMLAAVWPYYEGGRWVLDRTIRMATAEERRVAEYEKAAQIVAEYKVRKEREAQAEFDRQLRGEA